MDWGEDKFEKVWRHWCIVSFLQKKIDEMIPKFLYLLNRNLIRARLYFENIFWNSKTLFVTMIIQIIQI